jgi:hypothetical protein
MGEYVSIYIYMLEAWASKNYKYKRTVFESTVETKKRRKKTKINNVSKLPVE